MKETHKKRKSKRLILNVHKKSSVSLIKKHLENTLSFLYYIEDFTNYEVKEICNCIDLLQNTKVISNYEE